MQRPITRGAAANAGLIFHIFAQDSTSTTGAGKASIAFGSWTCYYIRNGEAISGAITPQDITTIGTYAAPTANTNIRIKAVDNTNMIGIYEVQLHSDWVNTTNSCQSLTIYLSASGVAVLPIQILLEAVNRQDTVRMGLTALPNAAAEAAGGLYTRGSGAGQINQSANGQVDVNAERLHNVAQSLLDLTDFADTGYDPATHKVQGVVLVDTTTDLTTKTGFSLSTAGILAIWHQLTAAIVTAGTIGKLIVDFLDAAISSRTKPADTQAAVTLVATTTNLTNAPTAGDFTAVMKTSLNAATPSVTVSDKTGFSLTSAYDPAKTAAQAGDAMALTSGERTTLAGVIWANASRTLTSFGTLVADVATAVWAAVTRSLTDKANFTLTAAYDPAKTAAQAGDAMTLTGGERAAVVDAVWDEPIAGHLGAGSTGLALNTAGSGGSVPTAAEIADKVLGRNLAGGSDGGRTVTDALRPARNKVTVNAGTMTVYEEDDTTTAWTAALTTDAAAEPIVAQVPA